MLLGRVFGRIYGVIRGLKSPQMIKNSVHNFSDFKCLNDFIVYTAANDSIWTPYLMQNGYQN